MIGNRTTHPVWASSSSSHHGCLFWGDHLRGSVHPIEAKQLLHAHIGPVRMRPDWPVRWSLEGRPASVPSVFRPPRFRWPHLHGGCPCVFRVHVSRSLGRSPCGHHPTQIVQRTHRNSLPKHPVTGRNSNIQTRKHQLGYGYFGMLLIFLSPAFGKVVPHWVCPGLCCLSNA